MELTREKVLAMTEGKELDKLIAERIMGWQMYHYNKDVSSRCYYMLVDENWDAVADDVPFTLQNGERKTEEEAWNDNKPFSTDITATWEVVNKLGDNFFQLTRDFRNRSEIWHASFSIVDAVDSPNAAESICKAALLTTLTEQEA